ncbi:MAG: AzlD domain-containing protein [Ruminococcus sp.]|nr:AzlD domain-containing protein [Ruminococcus sp.]MBQ7133022.1 AzlD domain-containing protein [Ruminococcus sp.]
MTDSTLHSILLVLVMAVVTYLLRAFPFLVFSGKKPTPKFVLYLGKVLPYAIIGMLVIYCVKDISFDSVSHFLPYIIAGAVVVILHVWRRNTLLSIIAGTLSYMALVQFVF